MFKFRRKKHENCLENFVNFEFKMYDLLIDEIKHFYSTCLFLWKTFKESLIILRNEISSFFIILRLKKINKMKMNNNDEK